MKNTFFWYYCLTLTVIYATFVLLLAFFNLTTFFIGNLGEGDLYPIAYFESFMALWAYLLIPASLVLMWWSYQKTQYALAMFFSFLPIFTIYFASKLFVNWGIAHS